jgi:hypothetical protein
MTIAAGFLCRDGIVLCADTEQQAWAMKLHGSKMGDFECANGDKVCYAYAGNTAFALSAVQKCQNRLQSTRITNTIVEIESILDREYRRNVLKHPDHATDGTLPYHLLLALWKRDDKKAKLYVTAQTSIHQSQNYECIGIGDSLGHYLIRPMFNRGMKDREALNMAAYALAMVKDYVPGCGGLSVFKILKDDGRIGTVTSAFDGTFDLIEKYAKSYDYMARRFLMMMVDPTLEDEHFEMNVQMYLNSDMMRSRREWSTAFNDRLQGFIESNLHLDLTSSEARRLFLELSMGLTPSPPPSPEPPEGASEP